MSKLPSLGLYSILSSWIKSYLPLRNCAVVVGNIFSYSFIASSGVPQGRALSPLLLFIFINGNCKCFTHSNYLLSAADLKIYTIIRGPSDSIEIETNINNVTLWRHKHCLYLNINKCFHVSLSIGSFVSVL